MFERMGDHSQFFTRFQSSFSLSLIFYDCLTSKLWSSSTLFYNYIHLLRIETPKLSIAMVKIQVWPQETLYPSACRKYQKLFLFPWYQIKSGGHTPVCHSFTTHNTFRCSGSFLDPFNGPLCLYDHSVSGSLSFKILNKNYRTIICAVVDFCEE